jgi:hypothetical protein
MRASSHEGHLLFFEPNFIVIVSNSFRYGRRVALGNFPPQDRVARGGCPPPAPTERSVQISRTTLFKDSFTAQLIAEAPGKGSKAPAAVTETAP